MNSDKRDYCAKAYNGGGCNLTCPQCIEYSEYLEWYHYTSTYIHPDWKTSANWDGYDSDSTS